MCVREKGFTLIELVMVILLIGIISVAVAPKLGNIQSTNAATMQGKLRADIRYAQNLAMTRSQRYRIYFNGAPAPAPNGYAVVTDTSGGAWTTFGSVLNPDSSGTLSVPLNTGQYNGITASSSMNPIEFNSLGKPTSGAATITVLPGNYTITIAAETGLIN